MSEYIGIVVTFVMAGAIAGAMVFQIIEEISYAY